MGCVCIIRRQRKTSRSGRRVSPRKARKALLFIQSFSPIPLRELQSLGGNEVSTGSELAGSRFSSLEGCFGFSRARMCRAEIGCGQRLAIGKTSARNQSPVDFSWVATVFSRTVNERRLWASRWRGLLFVAELLRFRKLFWISNAQMKVSKIIWLA